MRYAFICDNLLSMLHYEYRREPIPNVIPRGMTPQIPSPQFQHNTYMDTYI